VLIRKLKAATQINGVSGFFYLAKELEKIRKGVIKMAEVTFENEKYIISILKEIEYGSVTITLHAGKIAQIEREEKIRIQADNPKKG